MFTSIKKTNVNSVASSLKEKGVFGIQQAYVPSVPMYCPEVPVVNALSRFMKWALFHKGVGALLLSKTHFYISSYRNC